MFAFRGGMYQGYPSGGLGWDADFVKFNLATYAVELGQGLFERGQRWFIMQMILGLSTGGGRSAGTGGNSGW